MTRQRPPRLRTGAILGGLLLLGSLAVAVAPEQPGPTVTATTSCPNGTGYGGQITSISNAANGLSRGGNGCVVFSYVGGVDVFVFTGSIQQWTVPVGVSSVEVHLVGAGGGAGLSGSGGSSGGDGGGGGYATGTLSVTEGDVYDVIVGEGGRHHCRAENVQDLTLEQRRNFSFGGGAAGYGGSAWDCSWASGGGRSALRVANGTDDIVTAGGGGGGGYSLGHGGAGGGMTGQDGATHHRGFGGTQTQGGAGSTAGENGHDGIQYAGGPAGLNTLDPSEGGGGGGGYFGGGGAGNNGGGGGGSSFVGTLRGLQGGSTNGGNWRVPGAVAPVNSAAPTISGSAAVGETLTATTGAWAGATTKAFRWQSSTDGVTWADIAGAASSTYVVGVAGFIRVIETANNFFGTTSANSTATAAIVDTTLSALSLSAGTLTPAFSSGIFSYSASVPYTTSSIRLTPTRTHASSTITVNGTAVASGTASSALALSVGANVFTVVVTNTSVTSTTVVNLTRENPVVPGAPTLSSAVGGARTITVSFSAPGSDGGVPITDYEYSLNGSSTWLSLDTTTSPATIGGLSEGTTYSVRVRARNSVGAGAASGSRTASTDTPPTTTAAPETTVAPTVPPAPPGPATSEEPQPVGGGTDVNTPMPAGPPATVSESPVVSTTVVATQIAQTTTTTLLPVPTTTSTTIPVPSAFELGDVTEALAIAGERVPVNVSRDGFSVTMQVGSLFVSLSAVDADGAPVALDSSGAVRLRDDHRVQVAVAGFLPVSKVAVWLFSQPVLLGSRMTSVSGEGEWVVPLPSRTKDGRHTVLMIGESATGDPVEAALSVVVGDPPGLARIGRAALVAALVAAVVAGMFLPAAWRRRRRDEEEMV